MSLQTHYHTHDFKKRPTVDTDPVVSAAAAQTLTNKTLTAPVLSAPTGIEEVVTLPVSFQAGEQGSYRLFFPFKATINRIRSFVTLALAATDNGTITAQNDASVAMANGVITHAASAAFGNEQSAVPTTNNVVESDQSIRLVTAKTTAGGRATVSVEYTRTA